jgi:hypothetical protein
VNVRFSRRRSWNLLFSGMLCRVVSQKLTDVLDVLIRAIALMMEAVSTSEKSVNFCENTRCNVPEDSHLHSKLRCSGLEKSHVTADHEIFMFSNIKSFSLKVGAFLFVGASYCKLWLFRATRSGASLNAESHHSRSYAVTSGCAPQAAPKLRSAF